MVGLVHVLLGDRLQHLGEVAAPPSGRLGDRSAAAGSSSTSFTPSTSNTSTEWCATIARPASVTMSGCGTPRGVAGLLDRRDDVVRVLLRRVVLRGVEVRLRAVVVDAEAAADVEERRARAELVQARRRCGSPRERVLVGADRGDLRADVEVQQLEAVEHVLGAQPLDRLDDLERREPELRAVAGRLDPLARRRCAVSRARTPMCGRMPSSREALITRSISWKRSITMIGVRPSRCASSAVSM